jgi:hypothetical protein
MLKPFFALLILAIGLPSAHAGCDDDLRGQPSRAELLKVKTVAFSQELEAALSERIRQDLMNAILTRPVYSEPLATGYRHRSALMGYVDSELNRELLGQIHFDFENGRITVVAFRPQYGDLEQSPAFLRIGRAIYPEGDIILEIRSGFLKGFDLAIHPATMIKIAVKHKVSLHEIVEALKLWTDGRVIENEPDSAHPNAGVYTIIVRLRSGQYLRVIFAWNPPGPEIDDDFIPTIFLVTAFHDSQVPYRQFRQEAVELRE